MMMAKLSTHKFAPPRVPKQQIFKSLSDRQTTEIGRKLGVHLKKNRAGKVICLYGDLGAGKTTFVRGLATGLGITGRIQSPTFTYQRIYRGAEKTLYHFDYYRSERPDSLLVSEFIEAGSDPKGIIAIEWANHLGEFLPKQRTDIHFIFLKGDRRRLHFISHE